MKEKVLNEKKAVVNEIKENIQNAKSLVLVNYRGLDVAAVNELRTKFRNEKVVYKVYKNTMMTWAFKELGYEDILEDLTGPNAVAFSTEDPISAARVVKDFAKDHEELEIKAGYLEDQYLDQDGVNRIASIPPREVLLQRLLGSFKSPVSSFVYLIDAIKKSKEENTESETTEE